MDSNKRSHSPESSICRKKIRSSGTAPNPYLNVQQPHQNPDIVDIPDKTERTSSVQQQSIQSNVAPCSIESCCTGDSSSIPTFDSLKNYDFKDIYDLYTSPQPDQVPHLHTDGQKDSNYSRSGDCMPGSKLYDSTQTSVPRRSPQHGNLALGAKLNIFRIASCRVKLDGQTPVASRTPEMLSLLYKLREIALRVQDELEIERYLNITKNLELLIAHIREISTARTPSKFDENSCFSNDCLLFWLFCETTYLKNNNAYNNNAYGLRSFYQSLYQYLEEYTETLKTGTYSQAKEGAQNLYDELSRLLNSYCVSYSKARTDIDFDCRLD